MMYGYMLENTRTDISLDNSKLIKLLQECQVTEDCIYIDAIDDISERLELRKLIKETVKKGDTLIVRSIADLSNNSSDLLKTLEYLYTSEVDLVSIEEPFYSYKQYYIALKDYVAIDALWKSIKRAKGIEKAKLEGRMGRKKDVQKLDDAIKLYKADFKISEIRRITGISTSSLYREINRLMGKQG